MHSGFKVAPISSEKPKFNPDQRSFTLLRVEGRRNGGTEDWARSVTTSDSESLRFRGVLVKLFAKGCLLGKIID